MRIPTFPAAAVAADGEDKSSSMRLLICLLLFTPWFVLAEPNDSLRRLTHSSSPDTVRLKAMIDLAWELRDANAAEAVSFADRAAVLAALLGDKASLASAYLRKAVVLRKTGNISEALPLVEQAVELKKEAGDTLGLALALGNLAQLRKQNGDYEEAISTCLQSVQLLEQLGNPTYLPGSYNTLAGLYALTGRPDKAYEYYNHCLELYLSAGDTAGMNHSRFNLGVTEFERGRMNEALAFYEPALSFARRQGDLPAEARLLNGIGSVRRAQGKFRESLNLFREALELFSQLQLAPELVMVYNNTAAVYADMKNGHQALAYYHQAKLLADSLGLRSDLSRIYANLSTTHEALGAADSALFYFKQHTALKDDLFNEEKNRQIVEMQEKYESARKDQAIAELNQKTELQQARIAVRNYGLMAAGLLLLGSFLFGVNYFKRVKTQRVLSARESELNMKRMMERVREQELRTVNAFLDGEATERNRLAGELHDRLGSQLATVKLFYDHLASQEVLPKHREQFEKANRLLAETCTEVRQIAHNLASGVLTQFGLVSAIEALCDAVASTGQLAVKADTYAPAIRLPQSTEVALFRTVQELVTNTIKHAQASEMLVQLVHHEDYLSLMVTDNGRGITPGSAEGLGLKGLAERAETLGGTLVIDSQPGHGTTVTLEIPLQAATV